MDGEGPAKFMLEGVQGDSRCGKFALPVPICPMACKLRLEETDDDSHTPVSVLCSPRFRNPACVAKKPERETCRACR